MAALAAAPVTPHRLVYLGTPEMAVPPLRALVAAGWDVAMVVTAARRAAGPGHCHLAQPGQGGGVGPRAPW